MKILKWVYVSLILLAVVKIVIEPELLGEGIIMITGLGIVLGFILYDIKDDKRMSSNTQEEY